MSLSVTESELKLTLSEYDPGPTAQFEDHFTLDVALSSHGFAGRTHFVASRPQLFALVAELGALDRTLQGRVQWQAGWGEREHFGLTVSSVGHTGRLVMEARLASPIAETEWARQVKGVIGIMPNTLRHFHDDLSALLTHATEGTVVTLVGDLDADI